MAHETFHPVQMTLFADRIAERRWKPPWIHDGRIERTLHLVTAILLRNVDLSRTVTAFAADGIAVDRSALRDQWRAEVSRVLTAATLRMPDDGFMQRGGREGRHTEHLGHLLAEMQIVARSFPGAEW